MKEKYAKMKMMTMTGMLQPMRELNVVLHNYKLHCPFLQLVLRLCLVGDVHILFEFRSCLNIDSMCFLLGLEWPL